MRVFVSDAADNERLSDVLGALIDLIEELGHEPWPRMRSGPWRQEDRDRRFRESDVVLLALSPSYLETIDWAADHDRAAEENKPVLLVPLGPLGERGRPKQLRGERAVGFRDKLVEHSQLQKALSALVPGEPPPARRSPKTLPILSPPAAPVTAPAAGWYREYSTNVEQYWDGSRWTGQPLPLHRTIFVSYSRKDGTGGCPGSRGT